MAVGNVAGTGKSDVDTKAIRQTQTGGTGAKQDMQVGNAKYNATTKVRTGTITQTQQQGGQGTVQEIKIGNAQGGGAGSDVKTGNVLQSQTGANREQRMGIGNVVGTGKSNVVTGPITQTQAGTKNTQGLQVGNVTGGGTSKVVIPGGITQSQSGDKNEQQTNIGNVK
jgi:hypothetical protein